VAVSLAQAARHGAPHSPITADALGWAYYKMGSTNLAIAEFKESTQKEPTNAVYQYHLGMAYIADRRLDLAARSLRAALRQSPNFLYAASASSELARIDHQAR
jgi:tetratricopeptide (TPR) repeat protein